jgi:hypothetical protein
MQQDLPADDDKDPGALGIVGRGMGNAVEFAAIHGMT